MLKKQRRRRWLSGLLAAVMVLSLLPVSVFAADTAQPIFEETWNSGGYYVPDALKTDNWKFESAVTMTDCDLVYARYERSVWNESSGGFSYDYAYVIALDKQAGSGINYDIPDYGSGGAPWAGDKTMSAVYMQEGITAIGDNAFVEKSLLETVEIPQTVTAIGENAFQNAIHFETDN